LLWYQAGFGWARGVAFLLVAAGAAGLLVVGDRTQEALGSPTGRALRLLFLEALPGILLLAQGIYLAWLCLFWAVRRSRRYRSCCRNLDQQNCR
jgi:hypothetical protein